MSSEFYTVHSNAEIRQIMQLHHGVYEESLTPLSSTPEFVSPATTPIRPGLTTFLFSQTPQIDVTSTPLLSPSPLPEIHSSALSLEGGVYLETIYVKKPCCNLLYQAIGLAALAVIAVALALLILFCPPVGAAVGAVMAPTLAAGLLGGLSALSGIGAGVSYYLHRKQEAERL